MTPKQKIAYVKKLITDKAEISPAGSPLQIRIYTLTEYEDGPNLISAHEQVSIVRKFEEEGFVKNVQWDEKERLITLEMVKNKIRRSNVLSYIKTTDEFLQHRELYEKFAQIVDIKSIKPNHIYKTSTYEVNDDLIQLLIDLKIVEYDWDEMKNQTHRDVGNRMIEFQFDGNKTVELYNRVSGKSSRIDKQALELIARDIGDRFTFNEIVGIFNDLDVPESMFVQDTKWRAVFYILSFYASSKSNQDYLKGIKIIQKFLHPLMFKGDEVKAKEAWEKYRSWLKYSQIHIDEKGKIYVGPTEEEQEMGIDDWYNVADNIIIEPKGYSILPDRLAELWVLFSQVIVLLQAYTTSPSLDRQSLEKIYLEIIGKAEEIIEGRKVGSLHETYERPFNSLATAEVEAKAKNAESPLALVSAVLLKISEMKPFPDQIAKKMEQNSELMEKISNLIKVPEKQEPNNTLELKPIPIQIIGEAAIRIKRDKPVPNRKPKDLLSADLQPNLTVGKLVAYNDGSIKFDGQDLVMRSQIKDLCRLFMNRTDILTTLDRIREEIVDAPKRKFTPFKTISKYVSELHSILQDFYKQPVIFNQKEEGWYFKPPK